MCGGHSQRTAWRGGTGKPSTSCPYRRSWERRLCWDTARRGGSDTPCCEEEKKSTQKKKNQETRQNTLARLSIAPLFFHFFDLVVEFTYFSQVRIYQYAPLQPAGPTCLPAEVFLECVYIIISPSLTKFQVNWCVYVFFFFFSCQSDWIVSIIQRDSIVPDGIEFPDSHYAVHCSRGNWWHVTCLQVTITDRIVDRERRVELLARLLKLIGFRFVLILQHSHKELTTGCKKNM